MSKMVKIPGGLRRNQAYIGTRRKTSLLGYWGKDIKKWWIRKVRNAKIEGVEEGWEE